MYYQNGDFFIVQRKKSYLAENWIFNGSYK